MVLMKDRNFHLDLLRVKHWEHLKGLHSVYQMDWQMGRHLGWQMGRHLG